VSVIAVQQPRRVRMSWAAKSLLALLIGVLFVSPLISVALSSLKTPREAEQTPPTYFPSQISVENYTSLQIGGAGVAQYLSNSLVVTIGTIVLTVLLATLAAYGFSRFPFPGSGLLFVLILTSIMVPFQVLLTPLFVVVRTLHIDNSLPGLILIYSTFQLPFSIFVLRNSIDSVPPDLFEAAEVDGAGYLQTMRMMLPLIQPGIATAALFAFFAAWNEFIGALILLGEQHKFTLPIMLTTLVNGQMGSINWGLLQAGVVVTIAPCAAIFLILQRHFVRGLVAGAGR
jgi:multiple sugar transport system permease protein